MDRLEEFAVKHSLILEKEGECGICRPCVGFLTKGGNYLDHNPSHSETYKYIFDDWDDRLEAPDDVEAYHKHSCMSVLVHNDDYEEGLRQLQRWVEHLEAQGELEVVEFETGATGMQAMFTGLTGYAIRFLEPLKGEG